MGSGGRYEIIQRTITVITGGLVLGKNCKFLIDKMMDKGVKPLELGIALTVSLARISPHHLNGKDSSVRCRILREQQELLKDWDKMEEQNE